MADQNPLDELSYPPLAAQKFPSTVELLIVQPTHQASGCRTLLPQFGEHLRLADVGVLLSMPSVGLRERVHRQGWHWLPSGDPLHQLGDGLVAYGDVMGQHIDRAVLPHVMGTPLLIRTALDYPNGFFVGLLETLC
jgi:hypothetical protein